MPTYTTPQEHCRSLMGKEGPVLLVTNDDLESGNLADIIMDNLGGDTKNAKQSLVIIEDPMEDDTVHSAIVDCNEFVEGDVDHKFNIFSVPQDMFIQLSEIAERLYGKEGVKRSGLTR